MLPSAGPPLGGLYLKPPSAGGLCEGVTTIAVGQAGLAVAVIGQDGQRDGRGGGVLVVLREHHLHVVGGQHFQRAGQGRRGERVRIDAQKSGPSILCSLRYRQMAWVMARMCSSLKACLSDEPRCPEVPKGHALLGQFGVGRPG